MGSKQFSQERKLAIVKSAEDIGIKSAAKITGVHYTTIYDWRRDLKSLFFIINVVLLIWFTVPVDAGHKQKHHIHLRYPLNSAIIHQEVVD